MMLSDEAKKILNDILKYFLGRKASDVYVPEWSRPIEEFIAKLEAEISEVNNLLVDYAMSIYPHGDAPEWPTISQGVKDLVDYAKALDMPAKSGAACSVKADELIVDLVYKSWDVGAYGGSAPDEIEQEMELARDEAKAKLVEYIGNLEKDINVRRKERAMLLEGYDICAICYDYLDEEDKALEVNKLRAEAKALRHELEAFQSEARNGA